MTGKASGGGRTNALRETTKIVVWSSAGGRCAYEGCNKPLIGDLAAGIVDRHFGFVAHIVADAPGGPRGDPIRSSALSNDPSNLMLLCPAHHKLIDSVDPDGHPEDRLLAMKRTHERRIAITASLAPDRASHVLRYAANIGGHKSPVTFAAVVEAMLPDRFPAQGRDTLDIELAGSAFADHEERFWDMELENLRRRFERTVAPRIASGEVGHLSVFALAPQPLLIELGRLIGDLTDAYVRQPHREPKGWSWADDAPTIEFSLTPPATTDAPPALVIAVSAAISNERARSALGDASIWRIDVERPHNDIIRSRRDLAAFRTVARRAFAEIKAAHGEGAAIAVLPALPASAAVELGRVWMPKADLPLHIHDQNRLRGGFERAISLGVGEDRQLRRAA